MPPKRFPFYTNSFVCMADDEVTQGFLKATTPGIGFSGVHKSHGQAGAEKRVGLQGGFFIVRYL